MIGRAEIARLARAGGVDERTQERDYVLAWLLAAVSNRPLGLVFKGGTCLRRCYFPGYRYSEDLDFSLEPGATAIALVDALAPACRWIEAEAGIRADAAADPGSLQKRAFVSFVGPLGARRESAIKADLAINEEVMDAVAHAPLLSEYSDLPDRTHVVAAYSLREIWAEKTRSLLQRTEPRDLYDLSVLARERSTLPVSAFEIFERKSRAKGLDPSALRDRLDSRETTFRRLWQRRLADQVPVVPDFATDWRTVRRALRQAGYI